MSSDSEISNNHEVEKVKNSSTRDILKNILAVIGMFYVTLVLLVVMRNVITGNLPTQSPERSIERQSVDSNTGLSSMSEERLETASEYYNSQSAMGTSFGIMSHMIAFLSGMLLYFYFSDLSLYFEMNSGKFHYTVYLGR
jgi:hypothetical protein